MVTEDFKVCPADIDEAAKDYETPAEYALSNALAKALSVSKGCSGPVLDAEDNRQMLADLSGRWHTVLTAIALCRQGKVLGADIVATRVRFSDLRTQDINDLVQSGDGLDKAGGYGIQGKAGKYIAGIHGCYYNVVGLPVAAVADLLDRQE